MPSALATTASSGFTWRRRRKKGGVREGACERKCRGRRRQAFSFGPSLFSLSFSYLVERFKHDAGHLVRSRLDADAAPGGRGGGPDGGAGGGKGRGQAEDELGVSEPKEKKIFETQEIGRGAGEGGGDWGKRDAETGGRSLSLTLAGREGRPRWGGQGRRRAGGTRPRLFHCRRRVSVLVPSRPPHPPAPFQSKPTHRPRRPAGRGRASCMVVKVWTRGGGGEREKKAARRGCWSTGGGGGPGAPSRPRPLSSLSFLLGPTSAGDGRAARTFRRPRTAHWHCSDRSKLDTHTHTHTHQAHGDPRHPHPLSLSLFTACPPPRPSPPARPRPRP